MGLIVKFVGVDVFVEVAGGIDNNAEEGGNQNDPEHGDDGTRLAVDEVDHLGTLLDEDILEKPGSKDCEENTRGNPADDEAETTREFDGGTDVEFFDAVFGAPHDIEDGEEEEAGKVQEHGAEAEVHGIQRHETVSIPAYEQGADGDKESHESNALHATKIPELLQESYRGLQHGDGAGHGADEEQHEEQRAENLPAGHAVEHLGQHVEA